MNPPVSKSGSTSTGTPIFWLYVVCYSVLAALFIGNVLTSSLYPLVWVDEIYYSDPSYNLATTGKLTSSGWWHIRFGEFWYGYIHLHQFLLALWMKVFGVGLTAVRTLSYVFFYIACILWLEIFRRVTGSNNVFAALVFLLLLTCSHSMGYAYRGGRGDGLAILAYAIFAYGYTLPAASRYRNLVMIAGAALLPWSAIQVAVGLGSVIAVAFIFKRRQVFDVVRNFAVGLMLGGGVLTIYLAVNGVLINYFLSLFGGDINIFGSAAQYILWDDRGAGLAIANRLRFISIFLQDRTIIVFLVVFVVCFLASYQSLTKESVRKILTIFGIGALMGCVVFVVGLTRIYYIWIFFVHFALASAVLMAAVERSGRHALRNGLGAGMVIAAIVGLPVEIGIGFWEREQRDYDRVSRFVDENSQTGDVAYAGPPAIYALMELGITSYYSTYARSRLNPGMTDVEKKIVSVIFVEPDLVETATTRLGGNWIQQGRGLRNQCDTFDLTLRVVDRVDCGYNLVALRRALNAPDMIPDLVLWLDADDPATRTDTDGNNDLVSWTDKSGSGNDAGQAAAANRPLIVAAGINGRTAIGFDGTVDRLDIADAATLNTGGPYAGKTLVVVFRTGGDVSSRQVLYEQGGQTRGLNVYVDSGEIYLGGWNLAETIWGPSFAKSAISANTTYVATLIFDQTAGTVEGFLDGKSIGSIAGVSFLNNHFQNIGIGAVNQSTRFHDDPRLGPLDSSNRFFDGLLGELVYYNRALKSGERSGVERYLQKRWKSNGK